ncbi:MAG: hypothetical protein Q9178_002130 [Gyalolechia marmorata]
MDRLVVKRDRAPPILTMTPSASVSRRKHYRPVPGEPSEPTSTIVLTSQGGYYVDVRVNKTPQAQTSSSPNTFDGQLQWAFAGIKESSNREGQTISTWHHWIDSLSDEPVEDKGEMIDLEDGNTLEKGESVDQETGEVKRYEELWEELHWSKGMERDDERLCHVMVKQTDNDPGAISGMAIRIGGYAQGILKDRQGLTIERWEWVEDEDARVWQRTVRFGDGQQPFSHAYPLSPMANIKYIPPQMGPVSKYSIRALRSGPLWLLLKDAGILVTFLPYLPLVFLPLNFKAKGEKQASASSFKFVRDIAIQGVLTVLEVILLVLFIPALISLPGILFCASALLCILILRLIASPTQGPRIVYSADPTSTSHTADQNSHERWLFINGIGTASSGLQANIDRLSHLFGRQVLGIHNQSYGIIVDVVECLLQRCMDYKTLDVRVACEVVKECLVDEEVKKVVLVAHSQGGIIASMIVDALFMELSGSQMGKLEIYTFGSAASHFHNSPASSLDASSSPCPSPSNTIPHIEHYANEYDMVPRWGILYAISKLLNNRYAGKVFIREGASGHMFVDHYLDPIFPSSKNPNSKAVAKGKKGQANGNGVANGQRVTNGNGHLEEGLSYLDAIVAVDETIPLKRQNSARLKLLVSKKGSMNSGVVHNHPAAALANGNDVVDDDGIADGFEPIGGDLLMQRAARGKTVRELSRLWLYLGGRSPEEPGLQDARDRRFMIREARPEQRNLADFVE